MEYFINHVFRWTEPHLLVFFCLVILIMLPIIFLIRSDDSHLKISRLYNLSRVSVLTFFHRILYIYLIIIPMSFLIKQNPPCHYPGKWRVSSFRKLYTFPFPKLSSLSLTIMYLGSLATAAKKPVSLIFGLIVVFFGFHSVFCGDLSMSQAFFTISISYILHFYSQRVTFDFLHVENAILLVLNLVLFISKSDVFLQSSTSTEKDMDMTGRFISAAALLLVDEYMIARYYFTRNGYAKIGKPIDLQWETGAKSGAYFSILSSEEEFTFSRNLQNDIIDSVISLILYIAGLTLRHAYTGIIKPSRTGFL